MCYLILYLHLASAIVTTVIVTHQRYRAADPIRKVTMGGITLGVSLLAWPVMLAVAIHRYVKDGERFR